MHLKLVWLLTLPVIGNFPIFDKRWQKTNQINMTKYPTLQIFQQRNMPKNDTVKTFEPPHDKTNKMTVRPAKTQISLSIRPV